MLETSQIDSREKLQSALNERLNGFLEHKNHWLVKELFAEWHDENWNAFIFGGFLRDLMIYGTSAEPRDIDLVVTNKSLDQLRSSLSTYIERETRFGGLHVRIAGLKFDIWPLMQTWAFEYCSDIAPTPMNLPKTAFLNVEGVVAELPSEGRATRVYEHEFVNALRSRQLDINLKENPFPTLAAVRALITARRLNYSLSKRLTEYILAAVDSHGIDSLIVAQQAHYSDIIMSKKELLESIVRIKSNLVR